MLYYFIPTIYMWFIAKEYLFLSGNLSNIINDTPTWLWFVQLAAGFHKRKFYWVNV